MKQLIALLIIIPFLELAGLLTAGQALGWFPTLILVVATGVVGAWLAKRQGMQVFHQARAELQRGSIPGDAVLDGIIIFAGGIVLLTPGFFTDLLGFLCLIPYTRSFIRLYLKKWLFQKFKNGQFHFYGGHRWR